MPAANDLRKGMAIRYKGEVVTVMDVQHRTPGNLRAFVQAKLRSLRTGNSMDVRFSSTEKIETVATDRRTLEYSYSDPTGYHFMDPETYETVTLQEDLVKDSIGYLAENTPVDVLYVEDRPVQIELPASVNLKVVESPEGVRGDTATNVQKPATLETGLVVNVPLFIKEGEVIKVDTRNGTYLSRA